MNPFNLAHEVIKTHLIHHSLDLDTEFTQIKSPRFVYAFVDVANQTYHLGKTSNWRQVYERFMQWRNQQDCKALPVSMQSVLTKPSDPHFYLATDREGYVYPKLKSCLSEI